MKNKTYFITLTPQQLFFFGGEQGDKADYYLKGSFIPQQTALLGLVRHQVLIQNNLLQENKIVNDADAVSWIGAKSFEYNKDNDFVKIRSISPCYLVWDDEVQEKYLPTHQNFIHGIKQLGEHYFLPNYNPKEHYSAIWKDINTGNIISEANCYEEVERIGVDKNYSGKTENDSFFKQIWLKMKKGYSFGFYLTLSDDVIFSNADVTFGKESSPFLMKVHDSEPPAIKNAVAPNAIVLISDAFASDKLIGYSDFAVCDTLPFRNIVNTTSRNHKYYSVHKSPVRLQLLKKGSVFIANEDNLFQMKDELNSFTNFQKIGYNHFQLITIEL